MNDMEHLDQSDQLTTEEAALRALLQRLTAAWAHGDARSYAACFTEDADYVTFNGLLLRGRQQNEDLHGALFGGVLKGTTISATVERVDFLSPDIALIRTCGAGRKRSYQTYVVVKRAGSWQIRSFQNTRVQPFSAWLTRMMQRWAST
jgi:uncharacterized protein (TIGR02246 family)